MEKELVQSLFYVTPLMSVGDILFVGGDRVVNG